MKKVTRVALTMFILLFFSIQLYLTLFGGFLWPFSSHRLFSQLPLPLKPIIQAVLEDASGHRLSVHPGRVIPIEYSRCSGLVRNVFTNGTDEQKRLFCAYLLKRLNENPWWAFDEMYSAAGSPSGAPFISLKFETHVVEFLESPPSISISERRPLHP